MLRKAMGMRLAGALAGVLACCAVAQAQSEFPKFADVAKGYVKVAPKDEGGAYYNIYVRSKDSQMLAELPRSYTAKFMIATTIASGHQFAGLHNGLQYVYWKRYGKYLALMAPRIDIKASGDAEAKDSVRRLWTDRVIMQVPIRCLSATGAPVIDLDAFLSAAARQFFGRSASGANTALASIKKVKVFANNVELAIEWPVSGNLRTFHFSIAKVQGTPGYQPRKADPRIGYFTVDYEDYGKYRDDQVPVRYITRWNLQKRDPKLKKSPPKKAIEFYVEHTVPVRYRRWIKQGILYWNRAFEKVGILDAIVVHYQDKQTGAYMHLDPEDTRYNFIRWLNNNIGTAIGPSHPHPETGEILDADIVLTDGWIRHFWYQFNEYKPELATEGMSRELLSWLDQNPRWDPRIRLAPPHMHNQVLGERAQRLQRATFDPTVHDAAFVNHPVSGLLPDGVDSAAQLCMAADCKSRDMTLLGMHHAVLSIMTEDEKDKDKKKRKKKKKDKKKDEKCEEKGCEKKDEAKKEEKKDEAKKEEKKDEAKKEEKAPEKKPEKKDDEQLLDGIPESFIGPMLADLVCHEVGHTLGLRHNFKASSIHTLKEINSEGFKGKKTITGSVMDYTPVNINMDPDLVQGDYQMIDLGPYDMWAIEYGYGSSDLTKVLARVAEPELVYGTDEDTGGSDPRARRYDFGKNPLDYAESLVDLAGWHREHLLDKFVKKGQGWHRARQGYLITLNTQLSAISICSSWIGGTLTNRDHKGDPGNRRPIEVVPVETQRAALKFCIDNAFADAAFGLTPEIMAYMTVDKSKSRYADEAWPVHDSILGVQSSVLTMLMNPSRLENVYDNELRTPADKDALTLPEIFSDIYDAVWSEIASAPAAKTTARKPLISSLRRNLQREHMERLIDLVKPDSGYQVAKKPISNLALTQLRGLKAKIDGILKHRKKIDAYSLAHLSESKLRIEKVLDPTYIYNSDDMGGGGGGNIFSLFGKERQESDRD